MMSPATQTGRSRRLKPWVSRAKLVIQHSFHSLVSPLLAAAISAWVVRIHSPSLWGTFVDVLLVVQLGAHVLSFGHKDLLLRAFSTGATDDDPDAAVPQVFQGALATRTVTLLAPVAMALILWSLWRAWPLSWLLLALAWLPAQMLAQSHDVVILFARRFTAGVVIETTATFATLGGVILVGDDLTVLHLLGAFVFTAWGKALLLTFGLAGVTGMPSPGNWRSWVGVARPRWLKVALPFFAMGLTGMLHSRGDLYVITALRPAHEVGQYQVLINLLIYFQALANFVVLPFVQELYRMPVKAVRRVARGLALGGLLLTGPVTFGLWLALRWIWHIELSQELMLVAASYVFVIWIFLPDVYTLYKMGRERSVLTLSAVSAASNFGLNLWLVPRYGMLGALASSAGVQWLAAATCRVLVMRASRLGPVDLPEADDADAPLDPVEAALQAAADLDAET